METSQKRIVFFGNERLATGVTTTAPTLTALVAAGYDIAAVVSLYKPGKSRSARDLEIAAVAEKHGIPLLLPNRLAEVYDQLVSFKADVGILVAFGKIVPQSVIDIFPRGIVNIHPSLLPLHRGPTPLESVILSGENRTGVSIMELVKAMDAGPVYDQAVVNISGDETKQELADTLINHGKNLLLEALPGILDGSLPAKPQDDSKATYDALISKESGILDFTKPAVRLEREIRAYAGWPNCRTSLAGKDVVITKASAGGTDILAASATGPFKTAAGQIGIPTGDGVLIVEKLKPAGKQEMTAAAFLAGYKLH